MDRRPTRFSTTTTGRSSPARARSAGSRAAGGSRSATTRTKKNAARFVTIDGKRWVLPGDLGDRRGRRAHHRVRTRLECINTGGEKVFPEEVEEALKSHPDVFDALVVGVEDERWMQRVAAVVEPRPGKTPTLEELQQHCRKHIAGYKVPRQSTLVDKVARFQTGKPDYAWAKKVAAEGRADQSPERGGKKSFIFLASGMLPETFSLRVKTALTPLRSPLTNAT